MKHQAYNPFLPLDTYIPDGEPHVFENRLYLFGSHDKEGGKTYCMLDYEVWSAPVDDLSDWSCPGPSYSARQDPLYEESERAYLYAPDVVRGNDGRYYLYYCLAGWAGKNGYSNPIGVAVCDTPDGKYEYLGVVHTPDGKPLMRYVCFDPAVINDEGVIRLYYGTCYPFDNFKNPLSRRILAKVESQMFGRNRQELLQNPDGVMGAIHVTLADDMLTVTGGPTRIMPTKTKGTQFAEHPFYEGSSIRKIGDTYYFIYSSQKNHELCYATSRYPDRGFTFGGTIVSNGDVGYQGRAEKDRLNLTGTTHGSIECVNGQWYVFYHRLTHKSDYSRQACAERINILPDGSIPQVEITSCGLNDGALSGTGSYPAPIACNLTNGKMPHGSNRTQKAPVPFITHQGEERYITQIREGTVIGYKYFVLKYARSVSVTVRGGGGVMEVRTVWDGPICASIPVEKASDWTRFSAPLRAADGVQPLYFRWQGKEPVELLEFYLNEGE